MSTQATLFDAQEAKRLKESGIKRSAEHKNELVRIAQNFAITIARENAGEVNMDQVHIVMDAFGQHPERLGNAAGSVFPGQHFEWTGRWVKSKRTTNHGRMIRVWRLRWIT